MLNVTEREMMNAEYEVSSEVYNLTFHTKSKSVDKKKAEFRRKKQMKQL